MGGCYESSHSYSSRCYEPSWKTDVKSELTKFFKTQNIAELVKAHKAFFDSNPSGFIKALLEHQKAREAPKEFPEIEYEVKFKITPIEPKKKSQEPTIEQYLESFQFPAVQTARFLKDPINTIAEGVNHFLGNNGDERLVVIEKGGKTYLKEKGQPLKLTTGIPYDQIVIKRTEDRYEATMDQILQKVGEIKTEGSTYFGCIRKEKGDAFILDANSGRIFSFTVTRAHLAGAEGTIQRQLELEYAGYVPGFSAFEKDSEKQIVSDMVDLAKQVAFLHNNAPVVNGWRMQLAITNERKYDFVRQIQQKEKPLELLIEGEKALVRK